MTSDLPHTLLTTQLLEEVGPAGTQALRQRLMAQGMSEAEAVNAVADLLVKLVKLRLSRGYVTEMGDIVKSYSSSHNEDGEWVTRKTIRPAHVRKHLTKADLCKAEAHMKVRLPLLFQRLYTEVGNGGFGPGYGLETLAGIVSGYLDHLSVYSEVAEDLEEEDIRLPWPEGLIYLGTEGCTYDFFLDCRDPQYRVLMFSDSHYENRLEEGMLLLADTFDDWIGHWAMPDWASKRFAIEHKKGDVSFPE